MPDDKKDLKTKGHAPKQAVDKVSKDVAEKQGNVRKMKNNIPMPGVSLKRMKIKRAVCPKRLSLLSFWQCLQRSDSESKLI